ncbi:uncharacterized protein EV420DRAFT_1654602 [Desarmillaria tabescens]|uniref:Uncharacterized protein n=1 Tax=Armillaria tabescens TaxID=1929756 RepID=A0AA39IZR1_ARMTA|nr:uncharacterized protein EV420DRAFT_1654602 [Desarmillaria tabescens]KAK0433492.1 hypothetical protein EV420DRAFT_1654602 [Desarmillaria tabescens]
MSSAFLPSRGQCTQVADNIQHCQCPWFTSTLVDQSVCISCGHGIHAHVDYVSMVVHHHPPTQCVAYVQKTPLAQRCTCEAQLFDHVAVNNSYRSVEPWNVLDYFQDSNIPSSNSSLYSHDANGSFAPNTVVFSATDSDTAILSHDASLMPVASASILFPGLRHVSSPSSNAENIPFTSTGISSPSSGSSASSSIQPDIAEAQAYNPYGYFTQHPDYFTNNSYARQPSGDATSLEYQDYSYLVYHLASDT